MAGLSFVTGVLAARLLGPDDRGLLAVALFWPGLIASLTFLSIGEAVIYRRNHTELTRDRFVATVALATLILAMSATLLAVVVLPELLGNQRTDAIPTILSYVIVFFPFYFVAMGLLSIDKSEQNFRRYNIIRFLNPLAYLAAIILLWIGDIAAAYTFIWAAFLGTAVNTALCLWIFREALRARPSLDETSMIVQRGVAFHGATMLTIISTQADKLIVMSMFGNSDVGKYVVAMTLASVFTTVVTNSFHTVLFPAIASTADRGAKIRQLQDGIRRTWFFVLITSLLATAFLPRLLPLIFGAEFSDARPLVAILALAVAPMTVRQVATACVRAFGDGRTGVVAEASTIFFFAVFVVPALHIDELWAVAAAFGLANLSALLLTSRVLHSSYDIRGASWLLPNARMVDDIRSIVSRLSGVRSA